MVILGLLANKSLSTDFSLDMPENVELQSVSSGFLEKRSLSMLSTPLQKLNAEPASESFGQLKNSWPGMTLMESHE